MRRIFNPDDDDLLGEEEDHAEDQDMKEADDSIVMEVTRQREKYMSLTLQMTLARCLLTSRLH